jgi:hypothetical protein
MLSLTNPGQDFRMNESLTEFERMARGLPCHWFGMVTLDLRAYVDDSETQGTYSVLAAYIGRFDDWVEFDRGWRESLKRDGLEEFKAHDCEMGNEQFKGYAHEYRRQVCERFISRICKANLWGVAVAVDLSSYDQHRPRIQELRQATLGRKGGDPFYLAFQTIIEMLANDCDDLPTEETVRITFDIKPGFSHAAHKMYGEIMASEFEYRKRLHTGATFEDSKSFPGLQAADALAFEFKKYCESGRHNTSMRWQLARLYGTGRVRGKLVHHDLVQDLVGVMEEHWGPRLAVRT